MKIFLNGDRIQDIKSSDIKMYFNIKKGTVEITVYFRGKWHVSKTVISHSKLLDVKAIEIEFKNQLARADDDAYITESFICGSIDAAFQRVVYLCSKVR